MDEQGAYASDDCEERCGSPTPSYEASPPLRPQASFGSEAAAAEEEEEEAGPSPAREGEADEELEEQQAADDTRIGKELIEEDLEAVPKRDMKRDQASHQQTVDPATDAPGNHRHDDQIQRGEPRTDRQPDPHLSQIHSQARRTPEPDLRKAHSQPKHEGE